MAFMAAPFFSVPARCLDASAGSGSVVYVNEAGDVVEGRSSSLSRMHFQADVSLSTADYFRGRFDGVREEIDDISLQPDFRLIFELADHITFTAGLANGLSDAAPLSADNLDIWYESNPHVGFAGKISHMYGGLTYTHYGSPNDSAETSEEVTLDLRSTDTLFGPLAHWVKLAWRIDGGSGFFFEIGIDPECRLYPIRLSFPVSAGTGWNGYYAAPDGKGFVRAGIRGAIPLNRQNRAKNGRWLLEPAVTIVFRDDDLTEHRFDDAGPVVAWGSVALRVLY